MKIAVTKLKMQEKSRIRSHFNLKSLGKSMVRLKLSNIVIYQSINNFVWSDVKNSSGHIPNKKVTEESSIMGK